MKIKINIWLNGMMGLAAGDALGCPVQFRTREEIAQNPVKCMRGHGTYDMPVGTWTDDTSMALATLTSIYETKHIDVKDIMERFVDWYLDGKYTPFGESFDVGFGTSDAIRRYTISNNIDTCGGKEASNNGNGSLMRILPVCIYCTWEHWAGRMSDEEAIKLVHAVSGLTHDHLRAKIACGLYYFLVQAILACEGTLGERLQKGIDAGMEFYRRDISNLTQLAYYSRLKDLKAFAALPADEIRSSGYVVDSLEAAVWCLLTTEDFRHALLKAVNLGDDTDTIGAICGGLAGSYYGVDNIPWDWIEVIQKKKMIESVCWKLIKKHIGG